MTETELLKRITIDRRIFGGKPIVRGQRLAVEHVLGMLAAGDTTETLLEAYPWLEADDVRACLLYARKVVSEERIELLALDAAPALPSAAARGVDEDFARQTSEFIDQYRSALETLAQA
jgi:uncharacterized protein (DUF433 family)